MWARLSPKGEGWGEGEGDAGQNRPGAPGWLRRFAATLRLADSPALRREAAQPTPDIPHQKDTRQTDKFKPGLDLLKAESRNGTTDLGPLPTDSRALCGLAWACSCSAWRRWCIRLGDLEIEDGLTLRLVFGLDDLLRCVAVAGPQARALAGLRINAVKSSTANAAPD